MNFTSLVEIIHYRYDKELLQQALSRDETDSMDSFIAALHYQPRTYRNMFSLPEPDTQGNVRLWTGETITSDAGRRHILSEEANRILWLSDTQDKAILAVRDEVTEAILRILKENRLEGYFCCRNCSLAMWKHLDAVPDSFAQKQVLLGLAKLKTFRDTNGRWKTWSFYHTVHTLHLLQAEEAWDELLFAKPALVRAAQKIIHKDAFQRRQFLLAKDVLKSL